MLKRKIYHNGFLSFLVTRAVRLLQIIKMIIFLKMRQSAGNCKMVVGFEQTKYITGVQYLQRLSIMTTAIFYPAAWLSV